MLAPLSLAIYEGHDPSIRAFGVTIAIISLFALILRRYGDSESAVARYEAFGIVAFIWLALGVFGGLPFTIEGTIPNIMSAIFESVSGFTTTGATVIADVDGVSRPIHLWRCLSHWLGGMGIVVLFVAVFPQLGIGAKHLFRSEVPGPINESLKPRIRQTANRLWWIYVFLTVLCGSLFYLAGMTPFEATCHAFSTLSTGGFSTRSASIGGFNNHLIEWIAAVFMIIGGLNFGLYYAGFHGNIGSVFRNYEARAFLLFNIGITGLVTVHTAEVSGSLIDGIRLALFQTASVTTTTGLMTDDFDKYPDFLRLLLFFSMFIGGCAGSTAGGIKVSRVVIILKSILNEVKNVVRPQAVFSVRVGHTPVPPAILKNIFGFFALYLLIFILASLFMSLIGLDIVSAMTSVVASLSSIGPGLASVGPTMNYEFIPGLGKLVLCLCMIAGRLEIFVLLAIFSPMTWRR
jgi:trk system potassium uptake protein TrkH